MKSPNFFIVGAPKCGTTALYDYLCQHPDVFMPQWKEPHFFGSDLEAPHFLRAKGRYLELFEPAENQRRLGEASVWYLYSRKSAVEIREFCPDALVIIMLRNPVDVMYSYHSQRLYNGTEDLIEFREALAAEEDRKKGGRLPADPWPVFGLFYREIARFGEQVARYLDVFPRERVKIIIYDDFRSDTATVYKNVLEFLGVDGAFEADIRPVNVNKTYRSAWLRDLIFRPSPLERRLAHSLFSDSMRRKAASFIEHINQRKITRIPLSADLRHQLQRECAADVKCLRDLIGRDLRRWAEIDDKFRL